MTKRRYRWWFRKMMNQDFSNKGICSASANVKRLWYISKSKFTSELKLIYKYLTINLPFKYENGYCWPHGDIKSRIMWLEEQYQKFL